jgi:hypothetical protein
MVSVVYVDNKFILKINITQKQTFSLKYPPKFNCECDHICNLQHSTHKYNWRFSQYDRFVLQSSGLCYCPSLISGYHYFGGTSYLYLQDRSEVFGEELFL